MTELAAMVIFMWFVLLGVLSMSKELRRRFGKPQESRELSFWSPPENATTIRLQRLRVGAFIAGISTVVPIGVLVVFRGPVWLVKAFMIAMAAGAAVYLIASFVLGAVEGHLLAKRKS
jgi:hypothetical protein